MTYSRIALLSLVIFPAICQAADHTFAIAGDQFMLDGKPIVLISGEMHYPRVPRAYWHDRMRKMKAMGLNTLTTYVFWNAHEPEPGKFDFTGNNDLAEYIRTAQQEGLWVILRPGPYVCSEWDFGGLPPWLMRDPQMKLRQNDPSFLKPAAAYMEQVGKQLAPLQVTHGGPIIMVQVENEYGSFGRDKEYMRAIQGMIRKAGFDVQLYTADGAAELPNGTLPDLPAAVNFGGGSNPGKEFDALSKFRPGGPRMSGEFWVGWFDTWGKKHATGPLEKAAAGLDWMLSRGISVSLYMIHGGTNFGFTAGADFHANYEPDITSYDYDSPLDEAGRPTKKFAAFRDVIARHLPPGVKLPEMPAGPVLIEIPEFTFAEMAPLTQVLGRPVRSKTPLTMPQLGQSHGMVLYRTKFAGPALALMEASGLLDYAIISVNGRAIADLDRRLPAETLRRNLSADSTIEILLDAMGHLNFTPRIQGERKGLTAFKVNGTPLEDWEIFSIPLDAPPKTFAALSPQEMMKPAFYRARFDLAQTGDTYLDLRGWGKGYVWVNGHNIGRYWRIGAQQSLYVPAPWLRTGSNEVVVLELTPSANRTMRGIKDLVFQ